MFFVVAMEDVEDVPRALRVELDVGDANGCLIGVGSWIGRRDEALIHGLDVFEGSGEPWWSTSSSTRVAWAEGLSSRDVFTAEGAEGGLLRHVGAMSGRVTVTSVARERVAPVDREFLAYPFVFEALCLRPFTVVSFRGGDDAVLLPDTTSGVGADMSPRSATLNARWTLQVPEGREGYVLADSFESQVGVSEFWSPDQSVTWTSTMSRGGFVSLEAGAGEYGVEFNRAGDPVWAAMFSVADLDVAPHLRPTPVLSLPAGSE